MAGVQGKACYKCTYLTKLIEYFLKEQNGNSLQVESRIF